MEIQVERIKEIINHLRNGKLHHDNFDFSEVSVIDSCGTSGCAYGEFPQIFPRDFAYVQPDKYHNQILYIGHEFTINPDETLMLTTHCRKYLGLDERFVNLLFLPEHYAGYWTPSELTEFLGRYNLESLPDEATKEEVADNLESFLKLSDDERNTLRQLLRT